MPKGFFTRKHVDLPRKPITSRTKTNELANAPNCEKCGLYQKVNSPKMPMSGDGEKGIMIIAQAPGREEDEAGVQLVGDTGRFLSKILKDHDIDLHRDCFKINAVNCRTFEHNANRPPTKAEIKYCRPMVWQAIRTAKPKSIWLMGSEAMQSFWGNRFSKIYPTLFRGLKIPDPTAKAWVWPMFHPSYPMRFEHDKHLQMIFERDIKQAIEGRNDQLLEFDEYNARVVILDELEEILGHLKRVKREKPIFVFDYETTGIKPHKPDHKLLTCSFCTDGEVAFAFPIEWPGRWDLGEMGAIKDALRDILIDPEIRLVAQNLTMEASWSREKLKCVPTGWHMDTMVATHILDGRSDFTSLKLQTYIRWGVGDYDAEVKPYLTTTDENGLNRATDLPLNKLLHYNALDSLFEFWLYEEHEHHLFDEYDGDRDLGDAYLLFHDGVLAFEETHARGMRVDEEYYEDEHARLSKLIETYERKLLDSEEARLFKAKTGRPLKTPDQKDFSSQSLAKLFFNVLGMKSIKSTGSGNDSSDHEVLEKINTPFTKRIIAFRKFNKTRSYIEQFQREIHNGVLRPFFNLHLARSFRSSADRPSFQNIPVRDEESKKSVRRGIISRTNHQLMEDDYASLEVRIIACESECPTLVAYINDPTTCMHRDQAKAIFKLEKEQVSKTIRFYAKNGWVFPQFYTSYYVSCAKNLWPIVPTLETTDGINLLEHLKSKKIRTYEQFEAHFKKCEKEFWDTFNAVKKWQDKACKEYLRRGFVSMKFGHHRGGHLDKGQVINSKIQGPAFHCQLRSYILIDEIAKERQWHTWQCGQIHDSILSDLHPPEWLEVSETRTHVMTKTIVEENPWIIVPLEVERELSPVDGSWYDKVEVNSEGVCTVKSHKWFGKKIVGVSIYDLE